MSTASITIAEQAARQLGVEPSHLEALAAVYFRHLTSEDAAIFNEAALAKRLVRHYQLIKSHNRTAPLIEIFNPEAQDGLGTSNTVVMMVSRDRPFLVDTLMMGLEESGLAAKHLLHGIIHVERAADNSPLAITGVSDSNERHLSVIYAEIERQQDAVQLANIAAKLRSKIEVLDLIAGDFGAMRERLGEVRDRYASKKALLPVGSDYQANQVAEFLSWLLQDNFTFLGCRDYVLQEENGVKALYAVGGSGLGLLRDDGQTRLSSSFSELPLALQQELLAPKLLLVSKSNRIAPVHRPAHMDYIGIQKYDETGKLIGECRLLGLFTSSAYHHLPEHIPLLRDKFNAILERAALPQFGYADKRLRHLLHEMPRDELLQASVDELYPVVSALFALHDKNRLRLFLRTDPYQRYVSALVYVPRDRFSTESRQKIQSHLQSALQALSAEFTVRWGDGHHVRLSLHLRTKAGQVPAFDAEILERELNALLVDWQQSFAELSGASALIAWAERLPAAYREQNTPVEALHDLAWWKQILQSSSIPQYYPALQQPADQSALYIKVAGVGKPYTPSDVLPILEHFGLQVEAMHPYEMVDGEQTLWVQRYDVRHKQGLNVQEKADNRFFHALHEATHGESDGFYELILSTPLDSDDVLVLRALSRYMQQAAVPFSADYIQQTVRQNPTIAEGLLGLFHARFSPHLRQREGEMQKAKERLESALSDVKSLDEDRILRWLMILIEATLRTNFYQNHKQTLAQSALYQVPNRPALAFKFAASEIPELPKPKPMFEIFVYALDVEGVHLRGGKVARGGIRWSDRMDDYRTEVLGLVKAQMVKNAIIVPVGSKGGFVVKQKTNSREAFMEAGKACYKRYVGALLSVTDNLQAGEIVPPANVVRHDADDPYLVVAADKGTASFSNLANSVSAEYGFWLGDAFASGGSAGYDHKGMGITARGGWESVKRHFRELGKDIQTRDEITVVGIGDMAGDVFGNGMLLSKHLKLQAAFNHMHIFIDPNPDAARSFVERERLFNLARSTWADYDKALISQGGGCFNRSDKWIDISPEMQSAFAISESRLTPNELIQRLLKAPVDLIWNGGIGTYVKHSQETHAQVGDRANDAVRVNGCEVRAKVIGEGGNLGMTQRGRIEAAQHGVRLNTDAIDNSGGVNCSDHEVNIKILLNQKVESGEMSLEERNALLKSMTDEVAELVLRQNDLQPQVLAVSLASPYRLREHARIIRRLEQEGRLDRAIEYLPSDEEIQARLSAGKGLVSSELAVLLAYSKMWLYDHVLASNLPDQSYYQRYLLSYFPKALSIYEAQMGEHRLRREIISTYLTNDLVNHMGISFIFRMMEESGHQIEEVTKAYSLASETFAVRELWTAIKNLDNQVTAQVQTGLLLRVRGLLERGALWFLRLPMPLDVEALSKRFGHAVQTLVSDAFFVRSFGAEVEDEMARLVAAGVPSALAQKMALLPHYINALEIVLLAEQQKVAPVHVARLYLQVQNRLHGEWFAKKIKALSTEDYWDRRAQMAQIHAFNQTLRAIVPTLLSSDQAFDTWQSRHMAQLIHLDQAIVEVESRAINLATLSVLLSEVAGLAG
ncbi:MAG: NAD-glutamate dehydrogenase [Cardiobacteriaceae bacterium]|nr:NAD-glutamate dehydrogenase [Cardiobacteriaceae bacterium]